MHSNHFGKTSHTFGSQSISEDPGYTFIQSKYFVNGVLKGTKMTLDVDETIDNVGLGYHTFRVEAVFIKNFMLYTEVEEINFRTIGRIYEATFSNITDWVKATYDGSTGESVDRTAYFDLTCSSGNGDIQGNYEDTYGFGEDASVDLSNWAKISDIDICFRFRSTCDAGVHANFYLIIWGSGGDAHDTYYSRFENYNTMQDWTSITDSGWRERNLTLDHDDFDTLTSLTIAWGFRDSEPSYKHRTVLMDYIYIEYCP